MKCLNEKRLFLFEKMHIVTEHKVAWKKALESKAFMITWTLKKNQNLRNCTA